ncbi:Holin of 3TMs, for gene-transfer release [uncultured Caudovirales phage]|uniref:Holin of 3TMs, for gene-transfer release n=1 Tax=uncultured Caudovirales phage TaxID=2100421 RepID=A0A6J5NFM3_9CAUD|nr:Holin of 3TMs, for gene-transfer release [uncultured Caudovirales phage]
MEMLTLLMSVVPKLLDKIFPDPNVAAEAKLKLLELQQTGYLAEIASQTETNKVEAASASVFVAGWRPFIGWVCGSGLAIQFIVAPMAMWIASLFGHVIQFPSLDMGTLLTLLGGMLGLGGMRTFEKLNGVARH